jgi:hypothetical protein
VLERCGYVNLRQEPFGAEDGCQLGMDNLDRDIPLVPHVLGQVYRRHPALPEFAQQDVPVSQGAPEARCGVTHVARHRRVQRDP